MPTRFRLPGFARAWWWAALQVGRARRRRLGGRVEPIESLIPELSRGCSFGDVGCMWNAHGRNAFAAVDAGAREVVGVDLMAPSGEFLAEQERRGSPVRYVQGDLHSPDVRSEIGTLDVVFCSGVLYHAPHPLLTLESLREVCGHTLLLGTVTIPEVWGVSNGAVFFPLLDEPSRRMYARLWQGRLAGLSDPFDPAEGYGNWFWGLSASTVRSMLEASGFRVRRQWGQPFTALFVAEAV